MCACMLALWPLRFFRSFFYFLILIFLADASLFCPLAGAEAVGASTKEHRLREAIFNYGRELKAEANALREVAQGLAQAPAIGQTAETKQAMIRSLIKIGKLTANLMQGSLSSPSLFFSSLQPRMCLLTLVFVGRSVDAAAEEDVDQKVLSHACKNCASSAKARLHTAALLPCYLAAARGQVGRPAH